MKVTVKLFASLRKYCKDLNNQTIELPDGITVEELLKSFGVPVEEAPIVLINGVGVEKGHVLKDGDVLSVFPLIGGG